MYIRRRERIDNLWKYIDSDRSKIPTNPFKNSTKDDATTRAISIAENNYNGGDEEVCSRGKERNETKSKKLTWLMDDP